MKHSEVDGGECIWNAPNGHFRVKIRELICLLVHDDGRMNVLTVLAFHVQEGSLNMCPPTIL